MRPMILDDDGRLAPHHVDRIVREWIGVDHSNTLMTFTHAALTDFFQRHCRLPKSHPGVQAVEGVTKIARFREAFHAAEPVQQAKIIERLLLFAPIGEEEPFTNRTELLRDDLEACIAKLKEDTVSPTLESSAIPEFAATAIDDARHLADAGKIPNAADRLHSALHDILAHLAKDCAPSAATASVTSLFGTVRSKHPAFIAMHGEKAVSRILKGMGAIIDGANEIRNNNSPAHPTNELLDEPEAKLVYGVLHDLMTYVVERVENHSAVWRSVLGPEGPKGWIMYERRDKESA